MKQEFVQAIRNSIQKSIKGIHTVMPGEIISFDAKKGLATVVPSMKYKKPDGTTIDYPQQTGVPVLFPQAYGQNATIAFPVKAGDGCLILIAEQSIDYWLYGQETKTDLAFDLTNAICIPGLFAAANSVVQEACEDNAIIADVNGTRLSIKNKDIEACVNDSKFKINDGTITAAVNDSAITIDEETITADVNGTAIAVEDGTVRITAKTVRISGNLKVSGTIS